MAENENNSIYNPDNAVMFDSQVVDGIHRRYEVRVKNVQEEVSSKFSKLKEFGHELWEAQKFEELLFGRLSMPFDIINCYIAEVKLPHRVEKPVISTSNNGGLVLSMQHPKYGRILLDMHLKQVVLGHEHAYLGVTLDKWELPDAGWIARNLVKVGIFMTGLEVASLNKVMKGIYITKDKKKPENYTVDFTEILNKELGDRQLSLDMISLKDWEIKKSEIMFKINISGDKLSSYLKRRMPNLFV